jgi:hypothetical protein
MTERPILFSAPMVRSILDGRKSQTRRLVRGTPANCFPMKGADGRPNGEFFVSHPNVERVGNSGILCPHGAPGDRLWVKEGLRRGPPHYVVVGAPGPEDGSCDESPTIEYASDGATVGFVDPACGWEPYQWAWKRARLPSIHMPRWASRITLEIVSVRVERLQDVSEEDARAEGVEPAPFCKAGRPTGLEHVEAFENLWSDIHGPGSWEASPWVWVVEFRRVPQ